MPTIRGACAYYALLRLHPHACTLCVVPNTAPLQTCASLRIVALSPGHASSVRRTVAPRRNLTWCGGFLLTQRDVASAASLRTRPSSLRMLLRVAGASGSRSGGRARGGVCDLSSGVSRLSLTLTAHARDAALSICCAPPPSLSCQDLAHLWHGACPHQWLCPHGVA